MRYQTMNELWHIFLKEHPEMATEMQNKNLPNTAPMLFRTHARWEMRKALDSGCLCKACESFHLLRRGVLDACSEIGKIIDRVKFRGSVSEETESQLRVLKKIEDVLATPRKYDTVVKFLKPCLDSDKLESAKYKCLISGESGCPICGFK